MSIGIIDTISLRQNMRLVKTQITLIEESDMKQLAVLLATICLVVFAADDTFAQGRGGGNRGGGHYRGGGGHHHGGHHHGGYNKSRSAFSISIGNGYSGFSYGQGYGGYGYGGFAAPVPVYRPYYGGYGGYGSGISVIYGSGYRGYGGYGGYRGGCGHW